MEVFVSENFLDEFTNLENKSFKNNDRSKLEIYYKIYKLVYSAFSITSDISLDNLISGFDLTGNKAYNDIKDLIKQHTIKSGSYKYSELNFEVIPNFSAFYLITANQIINKQSGVIIIDDLINLNNFYSECTVNSLEIKDDYSIIKEAVPPCNSMIIIDKYLFDGEKKLNNLIKFIKLYHNKVLDIPFQLTIISSYENYNKTISPSIFNDYIQELDRIENFNYEILLDKNIPRSDRLIYTNYTIGNIGHPFDNRPTVFNQNFLGTSNNIKRNYLEFYQRLIEWEKFCDKIPEKMGLIETRFCNVQFKNRIFENLSYKA
jgi:hypothetical protein